MNRSIIFPLILVVLFFAAAIPQAEACRLVCTGGYSADGIDNPLDGISYCTGTVEWQGCENTDSDTGGGGGGGGGFTTPVADLNADPSSVSQGSSSSLTATSANVSSCSISNGVGEISPNTPNMVLVTPSETTTYTLICTTPSETTVTDTATVTVLPPPDLIGQVGGAVTTSIDEAVTLYGGVGNQGAGDAGYFPNIIQVCDAGCATVNQVLTATPAASLASGGWQAVSASYTPSTLTKQYYRVCANKNQDWVDVHTESNYGNNCSGWQHLTVVDEETPDTSAGLSCTVSATSVTPGQSVTYTATPTGEATGPYTWSATPSDGSSFGSGTSVTRVLTAPGSNGMTVQGTNTSLATCPFVTVGGATCTGANADLTITATPTRVREGQTTLLSWSAIGAGGTCTVTGPGVSWSSELSAAPTCAASGSAVATITTQSTYTLTCGGASRSVIVNVIPNFEEF